MEYAGLTLAVRDSSVLTEVQPVYNQTAIQIIDDDSKLHKKECSLIVLHIYHDGLYVSYKWYIGLKMSFSYSGCGRSGEDLLPGLRGCGCGSSVCYRLQSSN